MIQVNGFTNPVMQETGLFHYEYRDLFVRPQ